MTARRISWHLKVLTPPDRRGGSSCAAGRSADLGEHKVGQVNAAEAWRLVHEEGWRAKQSATLLGISVTDLYDLLAGERKMRDIAAHRADTLGGTQAQN